MDERSKLSHQSQEAYQSGDGGRAKELSERAKEKAREADSLNLQASDYIFRENNVSGRVAEDAIDLHGQIVEEAERILTTRIQADRSRGATHLHVIVGKGNHSVNHIQKLKPAVEQLCQERGLAYKTEANEGRIYVDLTGNQDMPQYPPQPGQGYHGKPHGQQQHGQPHGGQYGGQHGGQHGGYQRPPAQQQPDELETAVKKCISCCIIM
jgi:DNA-nicking Smr family endonuclease